MLTLVALGDTFEGTWNVFARDIHITVDAFDAHGRKEQITSLRI